MRRLPGMMFLALAFIFFAGLSASAFGGAEETAGWGTDLDKAIRMAAEKNLKVMAVFGAEWCSYCRKLDEEVFSRPEFMAMIRGRFVPVKVGDAPELMEKYLVRGFPAVVIINGQGKMIVQVSGYIPGGPGAYLRVIEEEIGRYESLMGRPIDHYVRTARVDIEMADITIDEWASAFLTLIRIKEIMAIDVVIKWQVEDRDLLAGVEAGIKEHRADYGFAPVETEPNTYELKK